VFFKPYTCKFDPCYTAQKTVEHLFYIDLNLATTVIFCSIIFVHKAVAPLLSNVKSVAVPTGYGNTIGNKGGVGISFDIGISSFCFITAHLAAHQHAVSRRTLEFHKISYGVSKTLGKRPSTETLSSLSEEEEYAKYISHFALVNQFDFVFWSGDLNYRIHGTLEEVEELLQKDCYAALHQMDQLEHVKLCTPFRGFLEGPLHFRPTYKLLPSSGAFLKRKNELTSLPSTFYFRQCFLD
jgi:hypothetical protein